MSQQHRQIPAVIATHKLYNLRSGPHPKIRRNAFWSDVCVCSLAVLLSSSSAIVNVGYLKPPASAFDRFYRSQTPQSHTAYVLQQTMHTTNETALTASHRLCAAGCVYACAYSRVRAWYIFMCCWLLGMLQRQRNCFAFKLYYFKLLYIQSHTASHWLSSHTHTHSLCLLQNNLPYRMLFIFFSSFSFRLLVVVALARFGYVAILCDSILLVLFIYLFFVLFSLRCWVGGGAHTKKILMGWETEVAMWSERKIGPRLRWMAGGDIDVCHCEWMRHFDSVMKCSSSVFWSARDTERWMRMLNFSSTSFLPLRLYVCTVHSYVVHRKCMHRLIRILENEIFMVMLFGVRGRNWIWYGSLCQQMLAFVAELGRETGQLLGLECYTLQYMA